MGVLKAEPAKAQDWAARSVGAAWRAFDWQMIVFAVLLAAIGQALAYSNTIAAGDRVFEAGSTFARGLVWAALRRRGLRCGHRVRLQVAAHVRMAPLLREPRRSLA